MALMSGIAPPPIAIPRIAWTFMPPPPFQKHAAHGLHTESACIGERRASTADARAESGLCNCLGSDPVPRLMTIHHLGLQPVGGVDRISDHLVSLRGQSGRNIRRGRALVFGSVADLHIDRTRGTRRQEDGRVVDQS